jgi:hypothetical protein
LGNRIAQGRRRLFAASGAFGRERDDARSIDQLPPIKQFIEIIVAGIHARRSDGFGFFVGQFPRQETAALIQFQFAERGTLDGDGLEGVAGAFLGEKVVECRKAFGRTRFLRHHKLTMPD